MAPPDPQASFWTLSDVAALFGISRRTLVRERLPEFEKHAFPMPLPWSRRERRYNPQAVIGWKKREEIRCGAARDERLPSLRVVA